MAMYTIGTLQLLLITSYSLAGILKQWLPADDSAGGGKICELQQWWDFSMFHGPRYGYFPRLHWLLREY